MRWRSVLVGACLAIVAAVLVGRAPSAQAADPLVLTASASNAVEGDVVVLTLTGCDGDGRIAEAKNPYLHPVPFFNGFAQETAPGVWTRSFEIPQGGDKIFLGTCGDGRTSNQVRIDVAWMEMFTDPFFETGGPLDGVTGSDCEGGRQPVVTFRAGDRLWEVHPPVDERGDWYAVPPPIPSGTPYSIIGFCSPYRYIAVGWSNDPPPGAKIPPSTTTLSPPEGAPGTPIEGRTICWDEPVVTAQRKGQPPSGPFLMTKDDDVLGTWTWSDTAGDTDTIYSVSCPSVAKGIDTPTFDVDAPALRVLPAGATGSENRTIDGTDCPAGTEARVVFEHLDGDGDGGQVVTRPIDLFGDWGAPVPALGAGDRVQVSATCGSVSYDPVTIVGAPAAPGDPGMAPAAQAAAAPASAVAGQPTYAG